jgi:hypothetical protein
MSDFRFVVEVLAPPYQVWETMIAVARWPEWNKSVTSAQRLEEGPLAVGSRTRIAQPKLISTVWRVTDLNERDRYFAWVTGRPGIKVRASHLVERTDRGSLVTLTLDYSGLLGFIMARQLKDLNWEYLTAEAEGLKTRCEALALQSS